MLMNALPAELLVQVLMHLEPEELSRCDQLCKLFHGPPSLVERALRLLATQGGLGGIPETLPNNRANWTQALLFLAILQRGSRYKLVAAGDRRSLFVNEDGTLLICGNVDGGTSIRARMLRIPTPVAGLVGVRVQSVVAKRNDIMALSFDGIAFSWGHGYFGQLGHGVKEFVAQPKAITALSNVCAIDTGFFHSLAITSDGALWSWGSNEKFDGKNGLSHTLGHDDGCLEELLPRRIEALAGKRMCVVAAGRFHSLAACVDGCCFSWGCGAPSGTRHILKKPLRVPALCGERVSSVATSNYNSCAVTWGGDIWLWGPFGRSYVKEPSQLKGAVLDSHRVVSVSFCNVTDYAQHCLALTADGTVLSWVVVDSAAWGIEEMGYFLDVRREWLRHGLGHGAALDAPCSRVFIPRPIEALAGQRIRSVLTTHTNLTDGLPNASAFAAGWMDGQAQRPQWACWSWGGGRDCEALGHGEKHADTSLPRRVLGVGVTPPVTE